MSSNDIDYDDNFGEQIINDSDSDNSEEDPCGLYEETLGKTISKKKVMDMDFDELKDYTNRMLTNKKKYIRKYQKSDKGKAKIKIASKKFYDKNRAIILEKKRIAYLKKKSIKMGLSN